MSVRRLWPGDGERLLAHFRRLDDDSRRLRFGRPVSDEFLARYCEDTDWLRAIMLGFFADGELRGLGELRRLPGAELRTGEFAVTVEAPWRERGTGTGLLGRLAVLARNRGIDSVYMICLLDNRPVQRIANKLSASLSLSWGQVEGRIELGAPSLASHVDEALDAMALAMERAAELSTPAG
jgi:GNAT superfamily N-acetyltransferase